MDSFFIRPNYSCCIERTYVSVGLTEEMILSTEIKPKVKAKYSSDPIPAKKN